MKPPRTTRPLRLALLAVCLSVGMKVSGQSPAPEAKVQPADGLHQVEVIHGAPFHWGRKTVNFTAEVPAAGRYWLQVGLNSPFKNEAWPVEVQIDGATVGRFVVTAKDPQRPQFFVLGVDLQAGSRRVTLKTAGAEMKFGPSDPRDVALGITLPLRLTAEPAPSK